MSGFSPDDRCYRCRHTRRLHVDGTYDCQVDAPRACTCQRFTPELVWHRAFAKSGPSDLLNGRWLVEQNSGAWYVFDLEDQRSVSRGYARMYLARDFAERHAVEHDQLTMARAARLVDEAGGADDA